MQRHNNFNIAGLRTQVGAAVAAYRPDWKKNIKNINPKRNKGFQLRFALRQGTPTKKIQSAGLSGGLYECRNNPTTFHFAFHFYKVYFKYAQVTILQNSTRVRTED